MLPVALVVAAAMGLGLTLAGRASEGAAVIPVGGDGGIQGDADCNGVVNPVDSLTILRHDGQISSAPCAERADTNCDGSINPVDSLRILRFDAGLANSAVTDCAGIGEPLASDPTSDELIDAALEDGLIDDETALLFRTYASFGDPRLPAEYAGPGGDTEPPKALIVRPEGLAPETEEVLDTFLRPPSAAGSWYEAIYGGASAVGEPTPVTPPAGSWAPVVSSGGHVTVWWDEFWPDDLERAELVAGEIDAVWNKFEGLLGTVPPDDSGEPGGNDETYDIYLVPLQSGRHGEAVTYGSLGSLDQPCPAGSTFVLINHELAGDDIRDTMTHELMHAFQRSLTYHERCIYASWFLEATATWAEDFVYPGLNLEHLRDAFFMQYSSPLPAWTEHGYSAYLFFLYLTRSHGDGVIRDIFDDVATMNVIDAIDANIPGGFDSQFHEFALAGWNQGPWNYFEQWDSITKKPKAEVVNLFLQDDVLGKKVFLDSPLSGLGINYFDLPIIDNNVQFLTINWPFVGFDTEHVKMTVLVRAGGEWRRQEVPRDGMLTFCRESDPISRLVIILSNADTGPDAIAVEKLDNLMTTYHNGCGYVGETHMLSEQANSTMEAFGTGLVFVPAPPVGGGPRYEALLGSVTYSIGGDPFGTGICTIEGSSTFDIAAGDAHIDFVVNTNIWSGFGFSDVEIPAVIKCPDQADIDVAQQTSLWWDGGGNAIDPNVLEGEKTSESFHYEWSFRRGGPIGGPTD